MSLVSIILPTHNRVHLISKSINSVILQTYKDWELIVVDDASTDNTKEVVDRFIAEDNRIKYYQLTKNEGACVARNLGIEKSYGDYIAFLDSDDEFLPEKIEMQLNCFQYSTVPNLGVVSCGREDYIDGRKYLEWTPSLNGNILNNLLRKEKIGAGTPFLMVRREILVENEILFDPNMPAGQDWDFLVRVCQHVNFDYVKKPLVKVNHHTGERVYTNERALIAIEKQYEKYKYLLTNPSIHDRFVLKIAAQNFVYGYRDKAIRTLKERLIHKDLVNTLWLFYMYSFRNQKSLVSKAALKLLNKITFN